MSDKITKIKKEDMEASLKTLATEAVKDMKTDFVDKVNDQIDDALKTALEPVEKRIGQIEVKEREVEGGGGFNSANEYWKAAVTAVMSKGAIIDSRFKAAGDGLVVAQGPDGGFTVAPAWSSELLSKLYEDAANFMNRCWNLPIAGNSLDLPSFADNDRSAGVGGGIQAYWTSELGQYTSSKMENEFISIKLNKLTALVFLSDEMVSDSAISIKSLISRAVNISFKEKGNSVIVGGTGAKEPRGIMTDPALISIGVESGQDTTTPFVPMNFYKMRARHTNYSNAVWLFGPDAYPYLRVLAQPIGTGGALVPLFDGTNLDGRPVIFNDYMQTVNTTGDVLLVDFNDYLWATKAGAGMKADSSMHFKFDYGQEALRFSIRADGQGVRTGPFTPRNSGATRSPFVKLDTRS